MHEDGERILEPFDFSGSVLRAGSGARDGSSPVLITSHESDTVRVIRGDAELHNPYLTRTQVHEPMSLEATVAVPFRQEGRDRLGEGKFVVALSMDRDWFSPDQAKRVVDVALSRGLLKRVDGDLVPQFDPDDARVPEEFTPDESVLREQSAFEQVLDGLLTAGVEKQEAVAAINGLQRDLGITIEAAAVVFARRKGVDVSEMAPKARQKVLE